MFSNRRDAEALGVSLLAVFSLLCSSKNCVAQSIQDQSKQEVIEKVAYVAASKLARRNLENYKGQNGILSVKTLVLGGEFRVTTVVPFKGNVADYNQLEIAKPISLVGSALSPEVSNRQVTRIKTQFESRKIFDSVTVIDSYNPMLDAPQQKQPQAAQGDVHHGENNSLDDPIGSLEEMERRGKPRATEEREVEQPTRTLVAVIEVIDYAKGSRLKQLLPLDLGKSILTVRLRYYDKASGQEIGRQIISGRSDGSSLLGPLSPRDALSGVADGFVDQITRRLAASVK